MSTDNEALARLYIEEVFNKGNISRIDELVATDFVEHNPFPGQSPGIEGERQAVSMLRSAFPDLHTTIEDVIADADHVVVTVTSRGTQKGEFMGSPATGAPVTDTQVHILRCAGGKCVEHWGEVNCWA